VVCKPESKALIAKIADPKLRALNTRLLGECRFAHMQAAVDAVTKRGTNIYVLPGTYREEPSHNPPCAKDYDGGIVDYPLIVSCGEVINLVTIAGDSTVDTTRPTATSCATCRSRAPAPAWRTSSCAAASRREGLDQAQRHQGRPRRRLRIANMTLELFRENALYVHETDGYLIDKVNARHNDLYGILTFTSDHGVISNCDTSYNGDSGVYPGSAADVNKDNPNTGPLSRFAVEIFGCKTHHNALGFSGTAGNSVYFHDNEVFANAAGYVTDSFVGGHPGMPQDHAWLTRNKIYGNNNNYFEQFIHSGICSKPLPERGYGKGTVCPAFPVPVGTGVLVAGGNSNFVSENLIYDNWRAGAMLFYVPGAVRGDYEPQAQVDTSNRNHYTKNRLGFHPAGVVQPNGVDFSWDEQGVGNCWQDNVSATGAVTDDTQVLPLADCTSGGSDSPVGNLTKTARNAPCATYNREDEPAPPGCDWFEDPVMPAGRQEAPGETTPAPATGGGAPSGPAPGAAGPGTAPNGLPATGSSLVPGLAGLVLAGAAYGVWRRRASLA
jgi:hypothetical protein